MNDLVEYCSRSSENCGESLAGTAAVAAAWLFLEVHEPWGRKVPKDVELPEPVRRRLDDWARDRPDMRIQLIRRPGRSQAQRSVFFAAMDPAGVRVAEAELPDIRAAADLDLDDLATRASESVAPTYFVCTHGARDRCCAKWGMPVYARLAESRPERTWQTSHLGGHRFAPTLITLPTGLVYGRVQVGDIEALVAASERKQVYAIDRLRGRANFGAASQVADIAVRRARGVTEVSAVRWIAERSAGGERAHVELEVADASVSVDVEARPGPFRVGSCGDEPGPSSAVVVVAGPR